MQSFVTFTGSVKTVKQRTKAQMYAFLCAVVLTQLGCTVVKIIHFTKLQTHHFNRQKYVISGVTKFYLKDSIHFL